MLLVFKQIWSETVAEFFDKMALEDAVALMFFLVDKFGMDGLKVVFELA